MKIDANEQIERFKEFMQEIYQDELHKLSARGIKVLKLDFNELAAFDHELADELLEYPEDTIRAAEISIEGLDLNIKDFHVRIFNLPHDQFILIRDIRSIHLNRFMCIEGIVRQSSDVRPQVTSAKFECPSCGTTITLLQLDTKFREPTRCSCGRRGRFRLLSKELVDAQRLVLEEVPESLESGEQPKRLSVFLKEDLVEPKMEKHTTPGSKVLVNGIIKEVPIMLKSGAQSIRYDLMMETNYIDPIEKTYWEVEINEKDEKEIRDLSKDPEAYEKLVASISPSIYGHEKVKEALLLQLMGGVRKVKEDGTVIRGDMHVLLVGDPGCISGDSQVALYYKGMEKIQNLGNRHLQPIKEYISKIRKNEKDKHYDIATKFHIYKKQPVLKIVTETGKEVTCTYNQPFLTKEGWKRADELLIDTEIRVMPKIPNNIKNFRHTNFIKVKEYHALKKVALPDKITSELASLYGYIIGDGNIHPSGYRVICYVNDEETDLIEKLSGLWKNTFDIIPRIFTIDKVRLKTINEGRYLRRFISKQKMHILEVNSKQVANSLSFLSNKRVPQEIFKSPNKVISEFVSWLFEADGCAFGKGRGRTAIQLKSVNKKLLQDIQLLLLYFGIHSRIVFDNLCIRRSYDMELFAKQIGFKSIKKQKKLNEVLNSTKNKSEVQKRKLFQRYEKIIEIIPNGIQDVYDFEVPISHTFIANGIVCHNSSKSTMLSSVSKTAPKSRFVAGKSVSGVGLTASVVKDEFLRGWALEAGAMVLANGGQLFIDELDKMSHEDRDALHEALEQQRISIAKANIQACYSSDTEILTEKGWKNYSEVGNFKIAQYNPNNNTIEFLHHNGLYIYNYKGEMYHFKNKRNDILVTPNHKMLVKERRHKNYSVIEAKDLDYNYVKFRNSGNYLGEGINYFILPAIKHKQNRKHHKYTHQHKDKRIPINLWLEFLGYYLSEGGIQKRPTIGIPQKSKDKVDKIKKCLKILSKYVGFTLSETKDGIYTRFQITNTQLFDYLEKNCGKNFLEKKLPMPLNLLSKKQLEILYDSLMLGDGSSDGKSYSSASKDLIGSFQAIALLIGRSASKHIQYKEGYRGNRVALHRVSLSNRVEPSIEKSKIKRIRYNGKVFCFSTKTGFFITRRNGKIAIQGNTLRCQTTVLAAANPKLGRFDPYTPIASQIDLPSTLINRFDLIFPIRDLPNTELDTKIASHVLSLQQHPESLKPAIPFDLLKKYISYAKQQIIPKLTNEAMDEIKNFYVSLRNQPQKGESELRPIPISARQLEALVRLSEGSARTRLSKEVKREDAIRAINLLKHCLMQVGFDYETGQIDIDRITTGVTTSQRSRIIIVREIVRKLEEKVGKIIGLQDVIDEALIKNIDQAQVEETIEQLKREGYIFEPKKGQISLL